QHQHYFNDLYGQKKIESSDAIKKIPDTTDDIAVKPNRFFQMRKAKAEQVSMDIAIIGISGIMPQSDNLDHFWRNLYEGIDLVTETPSDRWDYRHYQDTPEWYLRWGAFISDVDKFDASFFNLSPREAELMDPQQRLFLACVWQLIEDAGYKASFLSGSKTGVFVGVGATNYTELFNEKDINESWTSTGNAHSILANRISYFLNLHGPSEPINTACSSSLIAIHRAVEAIRSNTCDMAIAGGVNVILTPTLSISFSKAGMLSKEGRCKTFDQSADGYVRGEGIGAILLKPLNQAEKDHDHIYAVIRGSSENHGGNAQTLTAPNPNAQTDLLVTTYEDANIDPSTITYIEAHGTGTSLGDPIEINALKKAFSQLYEKHGKSMPEKPSCGIGSVKTNIGHLETAAGIASVLKVILALKHKQLPANLHFNKINPYIQLDHSPFFIVDKPLDWEALLDEKGDAIPRRAGISSFGFGGSNAHVILEEYMDQHSQIVDDGEPQLIILSAKNKDRLKDYVSLLFDFCTHHPKDLSFAGMAYTLQVGRESMDERLAMVVSDMNELMTHLSHFIKGTIDEQTVFTGNSKQHKNSKHILIGGDAGKAFINTIYETKEIKRIAQLWVLGFEIDWRRLYTNHPKRITLPTYPFDKKRYWITPAGNTLVKTPIKKQAKLIHIQKTGIQKAEPQTERFSETQDYLTQIFSQFLTIDSAELDPHESFDMYGMDSIVIAQIAEYLNDIFGQISPSLLYKYKSLSALAQFFIENHQQKIQSLLNWDESVEEMIHDVESTDSSESSSSIEHAENMDNNYPFDDIAIIGISGQFPMAETKEAFWLNIKNTKDCIEEIPLSRWNNARYFHPEKGKPFSIYTKWGGFIHDFDLFDPLFFKLSPMDARYMIPEERLFIQTAWSCIEDAGYTNDLLSSQSGKQKRPDVGVFVGATYNEYQLHGAGQWSDNRPVPLNSQTFSISNRVSYILNFSGPSMTIDTACSSSLVAIHQACDAIRLKECRMAIAGGVNLSLHPSKYIGLCMAQFASSDGRCRSFAEGGDGYVPGEAVGAVLLKSLPQAITDKDYIYAIIKGSAINHDGKTQGYTVPNPVAQTEVIEKAIIKSGVHPRTISYIEAHGTGTSLGDPIEITGLTDAFKSYTKDKQFCSIGSVKSNIGHSEAAAGIAQLTKVLMQMKYQTLVPTLIHGGQLNAYIDFENSPFYVQQQTEKWECPSVDIGDGTMIYPRRAGISSFGAGGVNAHLIIEEYPNLLMDIPSKKQHIVPISAKTQDSLKNNAIHLSNYLKQHHALNPVSFSHIVYTLQVGRTPLPCRLAILARDTEAFIQKLDSFISKGGNEKAGIWTGQVEKTASWIFENDDIDRKYLQDIIASQNMKKLARLWVNGVQFNWQALYEKNAPYRRIPLPAYAFQKDRYWMFDPSDDLSLLSEPVESKPSIDPPKKQSEQAESSDHQLLSNSFSEKNICETLQQMIAKLLGFIPPKLPNIHDGFFDMGMESVTAIAFQKEIEETYVISVDKTATFDYPNVSDLAAYLYELISKRGTSSVEFIDKDTIDQQIPTNILLAHVSDEIEALDIDDVATRLELAIGGLN
ncbi:MAG: hypothetical protein HQK75_13730, partial [Candidatus Magnetomorum sp.]|nr:hypothetical protein [Candidatus Magnetomorum sp.]